MKVLSDFDGVMTDQTEEGLLQLSLFRDKLVEFSGAGPVDRLINRAEAELHRHPTEHGWWSKGRVAAYADEDLFIRVLGVAVCLDRWAAGDDGEASEALRPLAAEFGSFESVANWAYGAMVSRTRSGDVAPMDPVVGDVLRGLMGEGVEIVVVSNSATDRVLELLETVGLRPVAHADDRGAQLRVRGGARKFELGDEAETFELGGRRFDVARPHYRKILEEERPDVAIGDVFSLDLATPLYLSRTTRGGHEAPQILLRTRHYTPAWSRAICSGHPGAGRLGLLEEFGALPRLLRDV